MSQTSLRTVDVARRTGISVNTVRLYEQLGYLPPVPRSQNGYRIFNECHVRHVQLVRLAMRCTWIGGKIRQTAQNTLITAAQGQYCAAQQRATLLIELLDFERTHAEEAVQILNTWANDSAPQQYRGCQWRIGEVAQRLHLTIDELRSWERNGLITVPRASNGYRVYGYTELNRLIIIRTLRRARYSIMSILRSMQRVDEGDTDHLREILDSPLPDADIEQYPTDTWLTTVYAMCEAAEMMHTILTELANPP